MQISSPRLRWLLRAFQVLLTAWLVYALVSLFRLHWNEAIFGIPKPVLRAGAALIVLAAALWIWRAASRGPSRWQRWSAPGLFALALAAQAAWLPVFGGLNLTSDFELYRMLGESIALTGRVPADWQWYVSYAPYVIGYSGFLALLFRVFGAQVLAAQAANALLFALSAVLLFRLGRKITREASGGLLAGLLWIFSPAVLAMPAFPATETLFVALLLALLDTSLALFERESAGRLAARWLLAAVLLLALNEIRPLGLLVLGGLVIYALAAQGKEIRRRAVRLGLAAALALAFFAGSAALRAVKSDWLGMPVAGSSYGFGLLLGLNEDTTGSWGPDDAAYVGAASAAGQPAEEFHRDMARLAGERLRGLAQDGRLGGLVLRKIANFWAEPNAFLDWTRLIVVNAQQKENLFKILFQWSYGLYAAVLALGILANVLGLRQAQGAYLPRMVLVQALLLIQLAALAIFDNNARYILPALPLLFLQSAGGVQALNAALRRTAVTGASPLEPELERG